MNMEAMHSISFIGMAGCGKSTLGMAVSKKLNLNYIDTDLLIENDFNCSLEKIKKEYGYMFVRSREENVILSLDSSSDIISTGGSAVYSEKSMMHLKTFSKIIPGISLIVIIALLFFPSLPGVALFNVMYRSLSNSCFR